MQRRLARDPEVIPSFVEESFCMYGVVNPPRVVGADTMLDGVVLEKGNRVVYDVHSRPGRTITGQCQ